MVTRYDAQYNVQELLNKIPPKERNNPFKEDKKSSKKQPGKK